MRDVITEPRAAEPTGTPVRDGSLPLIASPVALIVVALSALVAWLSASRAGHWLGGVLPKAATVRSRGSFFPPLRDGLPFTIRTSALTLAAAALVALAAHVVPSRVRWTARWSSVAIVVVALAAAATYGFFGYPHNAFPANSRIHWVDIYFNRAHDWWYTLVKLPHHIFYDAPYLLQAINGALNVALMYFIARTMFRRGAIPIVVAIAFLGSSLMLAFANTAEDVQLNVAALLVAYLCYLRRSTPALGVALFVLVLGRPQLVFVWFAVIVAEVVVGLREGGIERARAALTQRFVVVNLALAAGLFACWDLFLVVRGQNWLLRHGRLIDTGLVALKPIPTDGFTISPFSGAYLLHSLWIFPAFLIIATAVALWRLRDLPTTAKRALVFGLLCLLSGIVVSEVEPLYYFNVRYLAYLFPFLIITAFTVCALPSPRGRPLFGRAALAALLCFAVTTTHWEAFDERKAMLADPIVRAFPHRGEIRKLIGDAPAATTSASIGTKYYICYLLRRSYLHVRVLTRGSPSFRGYVFTTKAGARVTNGVVVFRDGPLTIFKVA